MYRRICKSKLSVLTVVLLFCLFVPAATAGDSKCGEEAKAKKDKVAKDCAAMKEDKKDEEAAEAKEKRAPVDADEDIRRGKPSEAEIVAEEVVIEETIVRKLAIPEKAVTEASRARRAAMIIDEATNIRETGIPEDLLNKAKAVAVFPGSTRAAFIWGARWGKGLVSRRDEAGKWLPPSYVNLGGGNFGFQIGVESTDLILVFTGDKAVNALLNGQLTLGGDAAAVAGPVGRYAQIGTDWLLRSGVVAYSRSRGLFAGVALNGAVITIDDSSNRDAYSRHVHGDDILKDAMVDSNIVVQPFLDALNDATQRSQAGAQAKDAADNAADNAAVDANTAP